MKRKKIFAASVLVAAGALMASAGWALFAQEGSEGFPPAEPVLGVLAQSGHRDTTVSFLQKMGTPSPLERGTPKGTMTLFVPGPEQLFYYGDKAGVVTFLKNLPPGGALVQVLVRDLRQLEAIGDKAAVLSFLNNLGKRGGRMEILLTDLPGAANYGRKASIFSFFRALPKGSALHVFTSARTITRWGADADLLGFFSALSIPYQVHIDHPDLDVFIKRWVALDAAKKK
ncbi:MAG: hypothetical protein ACYS47_10295 [Planctomycetota bacterium]|jgi:hypothetical protein